MKRIAFLGFFLTFFLVSCQESLDKQASREAANYTKRFCPTPVENYSRTDSMSYDSEARAFIYYCSFVDVFDNDSVVNKYRERLHTGLYNEIAIKTTMKYYVDRDVSFIYIVRSDNNPDIVLYQDTIKIER